MHILRKVLPLFVLGAIQPLALADTDSRSLSGFTEIAVSGDIAVTLSQGEFKVEVEAEDTDDVVTEVVGDTLRISRDTGWKWYSFGLLNFFRSDDDELKATVALPALTRVRTFGGAEVRGEGSFSGDDLELRSSGGSNITLDLAYDSLDTRSSGGSTMQLSGSASRGMLSSSSGSRQDNDNLAVQHAELRSSGGSSLNVGAVEELQARASGGSAIRYEGNPRVRDIDESGGANVTRR